jgi:glutathione reductase (NADPH)
MRSFDLVVIGSGAAGQAAATKARAAGWSVAVIDERPFGGTCELRGCEPKKVLVEAARIVELGARMARIGVVDRAPQLRWAELMRFKRTFTDPVPQETEEKLTQAGIAVLHGHARFTNEETMEAGGEPLQARSFVIASGAKPGYVGEGEQYLLTSDDFLSLESLPESLTFIGGGYISFEFSHVAVRAGSRVRILNRGARPLAGFDTDLVDRLTGVTRELGIDLVTHADVRRISVNGKTRAVEAALPEGVKIFEAAAAVHGAGRVPNIDALGLEAAGIDRTKRGVAVNEFLQSRSNPRVYAAGDAADADGKPLTPAASDEGRIAAENLLHGNRVSTNFSGLASICYTIPAIATVGLTQEQALQKGLDVAITSGDMTEWRSSRRLRDPAAAFKVLTEKKTRRILGAHILGAHAEEQINVFALAIREGIAADRLGDALFAFPTGSSDISYML